MPMKPTAKSGEEGWLRWRRIGVLSPGIPRTQIGAVAKTHLAFKLTVALVMQAGDQALQGAVVARRRIAGHASILIAQDRPVLRPVGHDLHRTAEAAFTRIEPGQLIGMVGHGRHSSVQRTEDGDKIAQGTGLLLEHFAFDINALTRLGGDGTGPEAGRAKLNHSVA